MCFTDVIAGGFYILAKSIIIMNWIILNFDLGLKGDYESLYRFLDNNKAQDCCNSNCAFEFPFSNNKLNHSEKFIEVKSVLEDNVSLKRGDRIYCIVHNEEGIPRGSFLYGHRQRPVWEGYGEKNKEDDLPF